MQGEVNKRKGNAARMVCVLLALAVAVACLVVGTVARFTSESTADDNARVAKFSIGTGDVLEEGIEADLVPGGSKDVPIEVTNTSEVAMKYTISATKETDNLPLTLELKDEDGNPGASFDGEKAPGSSEVDHYTLTITWPVDAEEKNRDPKYMGQVDHIVVTVEATQID